MSRGSVSNTPLASMNVVPYIDVMLVLLIIFMVTAPLLTQGVQVKVPEVEAGAIKSDTQRPIIITVDKKGRYYLNIGDNQSLEISETELLAKLKAEIEQKPKEMVLIKGDSNATHGSIVKIMAILQRLKIHEVGIVTQALSKP